jgi:anti-anti-sigma factor
MELTEETGAGVTIVAVAGRLDTQTARDLGHRLGELLHAGQGKVLIEASRMTYIGSAGFRALLMTAKTATEQGGWVALCSMTAPLRRMVEVAGLDATFRVYPTREAALAELAGQ